MFLFPPVFPAVCRAGGLSLGVGYPYVSLKYNFSKKTAAEAVYAAGEGINLYAGRFYWNFSRYDKLNLFTGLEGGYVNFDTLDMKGAGYEGAVLLGGEYFISRKISFAMDFSPTLIGLKSDNYKVSGIEWVLNSGLYFYFSPAKEKSGHKTGTAAPGFKAEGREEKRTTAVSASVTVGAGKPLLAVAAFKAENINKAAKKDDIPASFIALSPPAKEKDVPAIQAGPADIKTSDLQIQPESGGEALKDMGQDSAALKIQRTAEMSKTENDIRFNLNFDGFKSPIADSVYYIDGIFSANERVTVKGGITVPIGEMAKAFKNSPAAGAEIVFPLREVSLGLSYYYVPALNLKPKFASWRKEVSTDVDYSLDEGIVNAPVMRFLFLGLKFPAVTSETILFFSVGAGICRLKILQSTSTYIYKIKVGNDWITLLDETEVYKGSTINYPAAALAAGLMLPLGENFGIGLEASGIGIIVKKSTFYLFSPSARLTWLF